MNVNVHHECFFGEKEYYNLEITVFLEDTVIL